MKLSALLLLAASACCCSAQPAPASPSVQTGRRIARESTGGSCPVVLTSARITPYLMLLETASDRPGNTLDLEFRNASDKEIRSLKFSARIFVKKSIYDLDYQPAIQLHLTTYGTRSLDETFAQLRRLSLPESIHPTLVEGVTLEQVTFADGSVWSAKDHDRCGITPGQMLNVVR